MIKKKNSLIKGFEYIQPKSMGRILQIGSLYPKKRVKTKSYLYKDINEIQLKEG